MSHANSDHDPNIGWTWGIQGLRGVVNILERAANADQRAYVQRAEEIEREAGRLLMIAIKLRSNPQ